MAETTGFLGLYMKDPAADAGDTFNIQTMLNRNWEKIDKFCSGVAKFAYGEYTGDGECWDSNEYENEITADFVPKFLYIADGKTGWSALSAIPQAGFGLIAAESNFGHERITVTVAGTTVRWRADSAGYQMNSSGTTYRYILLG